MEARVDYPLQPTADPSHRRPLAYARGAVPRAWHPFLASTLLVLVAGVGVVSAPAVGLGQEGDWTLAQAVDKATTTHPLVAAARAGLAEFEARLLAADLAGLPRLSAESYFSGTPAKRGDPISGYSDYDDWGPYASFEASAVLPLYTFGKLSSLKEMAASGINVGNAQVQIAQQSVEMMVVRAYTALQASWKMADILEEGERYLKRARKYLEKLRDEDSEEFDDVDMLRLKIYESEVASRRLDMERTRRLALTGLGLLTGAPEEAFTPPPAAAPFAAALEELETCKALALANRGELKALDAAVIAQRSRVDLEQARLLPDIFLGGFVTIAKAWAIEEQPSPFAYDPYNSWFAGAGLGLKWDLSLGDRLAALDEQNATARKLAAQREALRQKVTIEVAEAHAELMDLQAKLELDRKAQKAAQGWLIARMDLYESGLAEMRELSDALTEFFKRRSQYEQTVMEHNVAVARLAHACGLRLAQLTKVSASKLE